MLSMLGIGMQVLKLRSETSSLQKVSHDVSHVHVWAVSSRPCQKGPLQKPTLTFTRFVSMYLHRGPRDTGTKMYMCSYIHTSQCCSQEAMSPFVLPASNSLMHKLLSVTPGSRNGSTWLYSDHDCSYRYVIHHCANNSQRSKASSSWATLPNYCSTDPQLWFSCVA